MDTKHTPEPWETDGSDVTADGVWIGQFGWDEYPEDKDGANAEHAVACVNACTGIKDPGTTIPKLIAALRSLVHRADTTELADGSSLDTLEASIALDLVGVK